jgi:hypothetical protein
MEGAGVLLWLLAGAATVFWSHRTHLSFLDPWIGREAMVPTSTLVFGPVAAVALSISRKTSFIGVAAVVTVGTLLCGILQVVAA